jgi:hypothetical protein
VNNRKKFPEVFLWLHFVNYVVVYRVKDVGRVSLKRVAYVALSELI